MSTSTPPEDLTRCIVSDCGKRAPVRFQAAEHGRLASRDWAPGDPIDLCPDHANDVYAAQLAQSRDQLAEWLRPDAKPFLDELLDAAEGGDPSAAAQMWTYVDRELGRWQRPVPWRDGGIS